MVRWQQRMQFVSQVGTMLLHQLEHPRMIDKQISEIAREGSEPQHGKWPPVKEPTIGDDRKIYPGTLKVLRADE